MSSRRGIAPGELGPAVFVESAFALTLIVLRDQLCRFTACSYHGRVLSTAFILLVMVTSYPWLLSLWRRYRKPMIAVGILAYAIALADLYRVAVSGW